MKKLLLTLLASASFFCFAQSWSPKADFSGTQRYSADGFSIGNYGYVGLGTDGSAYYKDIWRYDLDSNSWKKETDLPASKRSAATVFVSDTSVFMGLGWNGSSTYDDLYQYTPSSQKWDTLTSYPGAAGRNCLFASTNKKGYVGGGNINKIWPYYKDFWEYDYATDTWTSKGNLPFGNRVGGLGFAIDGIIYMGMGHDGTGDYTDLWAYNPDSSSWTQKKDFPGTGRMQMYSFVVDGKVIVGGGHRWNSSGTAEDDYYQYDPSTNTWDTLTANYTDSNRTLTAAFTLNNKGYIYGGQSSTGNTFNDLQEYSPNGSVSAIVERVQNENNIRLFPVPNKGTFTLELNKAISTTSQFAIYNETGKLVYRLEVKPNQQRYRINIEGLAQGIYFYNLRNSKQSFSGLIPIVNP